MVLKGQYHNEIWEEYGHWLPYITSLFLPLIDSDNGDFRHFPHGDSLLNEDYITMIILLQIQQVYKAYIIELNKKIGI
jgi:hypothetical protein